MMQHTSLRYTKIQRKKKIPPLNGGVPNTLQVGQLFPMTAFLIFINNPFLLKTDHIESKLKRIDIEGEFLT